MRKAERYAGVIGWFSENMPVAETELHFDSTFQLLVAVVLSAQCTDKRVNMVTPDLFRRFPTPESMAAASFDELYEYIRSVSYPNSKSRHLKAMAEKLEQDFGGTVPDDVEQLQTLPGVGRKTANVIAAVIFNQSVMPVDTHVFRVSNRIGLTTNSKTPLQTELTLEKHIPAQKIPIAHHWLILHGRYVCTARKPHCSECGISAICRYWLKSQKQEQKQ
jgi:endonuclease-3